MLIFPLDLDLHVSGGVDETVPISQQMIILDPVSRSDL